MPHSSVFPVNLGSSRNNPPRRQIPVSEEPERPLSASGRARDQRTNPELEDHLLAFESGDLLRAESALIDRREAPLSVARKIQGHAVRFPAIRPHPDTPVASIKVKLGEVAIGCGMDRAAGAACPASAECFR